MPPYLPSQLAMPANLITDENAYIHACMHPCTRQHAAAKPCNTTISVGGYQN